VTTPEMKGETHQEGKPTKKERKRHATLDNTLKQTVMSNGQKLKLERIFGTVPGGVALVEKCDATGGRGESG